MYEPLPEMNKNYQYRIDGILWYMRISRNFRLGEGVQAQLAENNIGRCLNTRPNGLVFEYLPRDQAKSHLIGEQPRNYILAHPRSLVNPLPQWKLLKVASCVSSYHAISHEDRII